MNLKSFVGYLSLIWAIKQDFGLVAFVIPHGNWCNQLTGVPALSYHAHNVGPKTSFHRYSTYKAVISLNRAEFWTESEVEMVVKLRNNGTKWTDVALELNRSVGACKEKYYAIERLKIWTPETQARLLSLVLEHKEDWVGISGAFDNEYSSLSCKQQYLQYLRAQRKDNDVSDWTAMEDCILLRAYFQVIDLRNLENECEEKTVSVSGESCEATKKNETKKRISKKEQKRKDREDMAKQKNREEQIEHIINNINSLSLEALRARLQENDALLVHARDAPPNWLEISHIGASTIPHEEAEQDDDNDDDDDDDDDDDNDDDDDAAAASNPMTSTRGAKKSTGSVAACDSVRSIASTCIATAAVVKCHLCAMDGIKNRPSCPVQLQNRNQNHNQQEHL